MRFEATIPEARGNAIVQLADELGLTRSQLIDEALTLFLKAVLEVKRGRRLVTLDRQTSQPACELATPTLSALEWALQPEQLALSPAAITKMHALVQSPAKPSHGPSDVRGGADVLERRAETRVVSVPLN